MPQHQQRQRQIQGAGHLQVQLHPNPSLGAYNATIYAADIDNTLQRYDFTFTASD